MEKSISTCLPFFFAPKFSAVIRPRLRRVRAPHPPSLCSLRSPEGFTLEPSWAGREPRCARPRVSPSNPLVQEERLASLARGFHPRTLLGRKRASLRSHEGFTLEPSCAAGEPRFAPMRVSPSNPFPRAATLPPYARKRAGAAWPPASVP